MTLLEVSLEEVQPQQMQRMCMQVLKCPMLSIKRTEFGPIRLGGLKRAQWRELTASEVEKLKGSVSARSGSHRGLRNEGMDDLEHDNAVIIHEDSRNSIGSMQYRKRGKPGGSKNKAKRPGTGYASRGMYVKGSGEGSAPPRRRR